jgi:hypothetical protein
MLFKMYSSCSGILPNYWVLAVCRQEFVAVFTCELVEPAIVVVVVKKKPLH